jgi:hypothetical protein
MLPEKNSSNLYNGKERAKKLLRIPWITAIKSSSVPVRGGRRQIRRSIATGTLDVKRRKVGAGDNFG